ncbi:MAG: hypothetical protein J6B10_01650 [Lachnospiraceae bacterium]|nr:hypothetical protein [Lachnospiraceae bacterium]
MKQEKITSTPNGQQPANDYDDGNIPTIDLPENSKNAEETESVEPLPESTRPRKDGPGGD